MNILIFLIILLVLVVVHEFGHFITAKKFGIRVDEFGFGFPPRALKLFRRGETLFTLNWLPLGGFVKIFGENPDDENTNGPDKDRSFVHKPKWQQAIVLFAGIFANFLLAWLLFSFGFMSGLPTSVGAEAKGYELKNVNLVVVSVLPDSPAQVAGLKSGDKIISVKTENDTIGDINPESMKSFIVEHPTDKIFIGYGRGKDKNINYAEVIPVLNTENGTSMVGISMDQIGTLKLPLFPALWAGLKLDWSVTKATVVGLYDLIADGLRGKGDISSISGPVGIVGIVGDAYEFGFVYLLSFAALISVNLAIINLIPFPALDGGRLLFLLIERVKGSRINPKIANMTNMIGFAILIAFMIFVTYHDIIKLI
jgi:regulator of sigma E protease